MIFRTKKHNNQNAVSGLNSIIQGAKERISELGDRTIKDTQPQQLRQRRLTDKKIPVSGICEIIIKDLSFM